MKFMPCFRPSKWAFPIFAAGCLIAVQAVQAQTPLTLSSGWQLQDASNVTGSGSTLSLTGYQPTGWYPAAVPGTVLTSLVNSGVYPEPLYGINNNSIPDTLCRTSYWYRTTFTVPSSYAGKRVWLNFNGINYIATVWVNGTNVGTIQGAFARGNFDVTSYVTVGGTNAVAVFVQPEPNPGTATVQTIASGVGQNGGATGKDGPTFLCSIGWDWIPTIRDRNTGIWRDVTISSSGPALIQNPYVTSQLPLPGTSSADLTVQANVSNTTTTAQTGTLTGTIDGTITFQQNVSLPASGQQTVVFNASNTPSLHVLNPLLWWPNGYGPQNLHTLHLSFSIGGVVSDAQDASFGIRQISYSLPGSTNLAISVNGVPIICKGGDWGMDEAMKRIPTSRLDAQVHLHQLANYTMIRNWVGQSTSEDFYSLCDKYGILVWDEFFQPNPSDGPDPTNTDLYLANVQEKILRFRNHPCIALWCGRNEGDPSPTAITQGLSNLLAALDPTRLYQPNSSSGRGIASGGPYHWQNPSDFYYGSEPFKTEIGSVSVPTLEAVHAMMPSSDWEVINDDWAAHDLCGGAQQGDIYPQIIASRYGWMSSHADFVRKAQLANYEDFRAMYEARFSKLFNPVSGVITWMSNPAQPSFVWQLYSYDLEPNASLFGAKKACEPIHIALNQSNWHAMVINSTAQSLPGMSVKTTVYNLDGSLRYTQTNTVTAAASAATDVGAILFPSGLSAVHFVKLELRNSQNQLVSDNFYWRETANGNFQALDSLPMVTLNVQAVKQTSGSNTLLNVTLANPSSNIALMSHLQLRRASSGQRVLPVYYSDNYVSLLPGESRSVTVTAATADLNGDAPLLAIDGWNVTVTPSAASGSLAAVTNNPPAQASSAVTSTMVPTYKINCGGGPTQFFQFGPPYTYTGYAGFMEDRYSSGGNSVGTSATINTNVLNAAPQSVYQSERWGTFAYTIAVSSAANYTVRLHFAETKYNTVGARTFNVAINGRQVLTNFDIFAAAGANTAVVRDFADIVPDSNSNIVVSFTAGTADSPKICGIEVLPTPAQPNQALNRPVTASSTDGHAAANAVDGNMGTRWSSGYTDNEWIYVDLGAVVPIAGVNLKWETAYASSYKIQISNDATNWTDVYSTTTGAGGTEEIIFSSTTRYVKILGVKRATTWGYSLWEFQVLGSGYMPQAEGVYSLVCKKSGMALDNAGSTTSGTAVTQWSQISGNINQKWELQDVGGGYYNIICQKSGKTLDDSGGSTTAGTVMIQYPVQLNNINQHWKFVSVGNGYYNIICQRSGMALDNSGSTTNGTSVIQWSVQSGNTNQQWQLIYAP